MAILDLVRKLPIIREIGEIVTENQILKDHLYSLSNVNKSNIPGTFSQVIDPGSGNCKGFFYKCLCGNAEYQLLNVYEFLRNESHECGACKRKFNLLLSVGAIESDGTFKMKAQEVAAALSNLPVRPFTRVQPRPPFLPTDGGNDVAAPLVDESNWDGDENKPRSKAFANNDPGIGGLF